MLKGEEIKKALNKEYNTDHKNWYCYLFKHLRDTQTIFIKDQNLWVIKRNLTDKLTSSLGDIIEISKDKKELLTNGLKEYGYRKIDYNELYKLSEEKIEDILNRQTKPFLEDVFFLRGPIYAELKGTYKYSLTPKPSPKNKIYNLYKNTDNYIKIKVESNAQNKLNELNKKLEKEQIGPMFG